MSVIDDMKRRRDQVALEADKLLRINRKQGELGQWRKQVDQSIVQLGHAAFSLHGLGRSLPPELTEICLQIGALNSQILQAERAIERIRQESLPDPTLAAGAPCVVCGFSVPETAAFCPNCGNPRPKPTSMACSNCGASLPPDARFCANCGQTTAAGSADADLPETS